MALSMLQFFLWEMYLLGAFISGWMKRRRGKIVAVEIMIVIVLLNGGRGDNLEWICAAVGRGGDKNSFEWISCRFLLIVIFTLCIHEYNITYEIA